MALSMDEQRMLAEIERRLAAEDPGLAARLSSFKRPGPALGLRSPRVRIIGSILTVTLVAVVSLMVYAMIPLRSHSGRMFPGRQASPGNPMVTMSGTSPAATGARPAAPRTTASGAMTTAAIGPQDTPAGRPSSRTPRQRVNVKRSATAQAIAHAP